jgi:hypothetical protein
MRFRLICSDCGAMPQESGGARQQVTSCRKAKGLPHTKRHSRFRFSEPEAISGVNTNVPVYSTLSSEEISNAK